MPIETGIWRIHENADPVSLFHFRDRDGAEVDILIERGTQALAGVEVKAGATVTASDFRALRKRKAATGNRFVGGVVFYDGETSVRFDDGLYAVPLCLLWDRNLSAPRSTQPPATKNRELAPRRNVVWGAARPTTDRKQALLCSSSPLSCGARTPGRRFGLV